MGAKVPLVVSSWVQYFFSWVFGGSKIFSRGSFGCMKLFLVGISCVTREFISDEYE